MAHALAYEGELFMFGSAAEIVFHGTQSKMVPLFVHMYICTNNVHMCELLRKTHFCQWFEGCGNFDDD